jgi:hypothetical protein
MEMNEFKILLMNQTENQYINFFYKYKLKR